jgi:DsbC/DsbD-like thiol-disulfide interchange protein
LRRFSHRWFGPVTFVAMTLVLSAAARAEALSSPWAEGHNYKIRLIAGSASYNSSKVQTFAAVELRMSQGWKTYWRLPGDAGGMPPRFDWAGSSNLASADVLYPAPKRIKDALGDTLGYYGVALFPVAIRAIDPSQSVELKVDLEFGVCREICIPADAKLSLTVPAGAIEPSADIAAALEIVPREAGLRRPGDPELKRVDAQLDGNKPRLLVEAAYPGAGGPVDLFVEAPGDIYLPVPVKVSEGNGRATFEVDLSQNTDAPDLKGKTLRVTMTSPFGQSEATWTVK